MITKELKSNVSMTKLGEVKIGDNGLSSKCSEKDAFKILNNEGCSLGANLVVITSENKSDILGSCYR